MAEGTENKSRKVWSGYECPACYAVFRVPKGSEHRPVYCPGCDAILRLSSQPVKTVLPLPDEPAPGPPVMEELEAVQEEVAEVTDAGVVRKRRRRRSSAPWERTDQGRPRQRGDAFVPVALLLSIAVFVGALFALGWFMDEPAEPAEITPRPGSALRISMDDEADAIPEEDEGTEVIGDVTEDREVILGAVREFLEAPTVDDLLKTIRFPDRMEPKVRKYYRNRPYAPISPQAIAEDGSISNAGEMISLSVTLPDFRMRAIALEWKDGRYLVDWASWVGYSESDWKTFIKEQPLRSRLFRVVSRPVDYFNFGFSDDRKWRCFELTVPGEEKVLYGYVEVDSRLERALTPLDPDTTSAAFILRLRYPEDRRTDNQVLIEKVVESGWVMREEGP